MTSTTLRAAGLALTIASCFTLSERLSAATASTTTSSTITYTASGTFATPASSGSDTLRLAGEPFSVSITVSSATKPAQTGKNWDLYTKLKLAGTVHSGLLGSEPVDIDSGAASIQQFIDPGNPGLFLMGAPLKIVGLSLTIRANITLPAGTLSKATLEAFKSVTLTASNASMVYSDGTTNTTLAIASGTLKAVASSSSSAGTAAGDGNILRLHPGAVQAFTLHADGTESVQGADSRPVDMGQLSDTVTLSFYASGVSNHSEIRAQIAGEDVPLMHAGPSAYPGLDQVFVQIPRSLAGRGATEVTMTVDGCTSNPLPLYIQ